VTRLGVSGRLRQLELLRARLDLTSDLLLREEADDALRDRLRLQINDIVGEPITEYGAVGDSDIDPQILAHDPDLPALWPDLPWWRRWILVPFAGNIWGRVLAVMYYYWLFIFVLSSLVMITSSYGPDTMSEIFPGWLALVGLMLLTRHGVRWLYGLGRKARVDQIFARVHRGLPGGG